MADDSIRSVVAIGPASLRGHGVTALIAALCVATTSGFAAEPAKVTVKSEALGREIGFSVLLPDSYKTNMVKRYPVIYILGGWYEDGTWLFFSNHFGLNGFLRNFADEKQVILVNFGLPNDWYYDAPLVPANRYGTFVTRDLIAAVDKKYRTVAKREGRAITGFSSGGHGAQFLGFKNPHLYIAVGSVYSCPDLTRYVGSRPDWNLPRDLGKYEDHKDNWVKYSIAPYVPPLKGKGLAIWMGVGLNDELLSDNRKLSRQMKELGVEHTYHEAPGGHDGRYASVGFKECMAFLAKHLKR